MLYVHLEGVGSTKTSVISREKTESAQPRVPAGRRDFTCLSAAQSPGFAEEMEVTDVLFPRLARTPGWVWALLSQPGRFRAAPGTPWEDLHVGVPTCTASPVCLLHDRRASCVCDTGKATQLPGSQS